MAKYWIYIWSVVWWSKWTIPYLVIITRNWLSGRKIFFPPVSVKEIAFKNKSWVVNLKKDVDSRGNDSKNSQENNVSEVRGCNIQAIDGDAGYSNSFLLDNTNLSKIKK